MCLPAILDSQAEIGHNGEDGVCIMQPSVSGPDYDPACPRPLRWRRQLHGGARKRRGPAEQFALPIERRREILPSVGAAGVRPEAEEPGASADLWCFDSVNTTGWGGASHFLRITSADAVSLQEIWKATSQDCIEAEQLARKDKWSLGAGPSVVTAAGGISAGVAVAARSHFGLAEWCAQLRGPDLSSRLRAAWFPGVARGGVHLITAYLWTSEPPTSMRKRAWLEALAQLLDALSGPWIVSAD